MPNRRQAIIWTNADLVHWCIYAAPGGGELTQPRQFWINFLEMFFAFWSIWKIVETNYVWLIHIITTSLRELNAKPLNAKGSSWSFQHTLNHFTKCRSVAGIINSIVISTSNVLKMFPIMNVWYNYIYYRLMWNKSYKFHLETSFRVNIMAYIYRKHYVSD